MMEIVESQLTKSFHSRRHLIINPPVCKSISHFNWFARYQVSQCVADTASPIKKNTNNKNC